MDTSTVVSDVAKISSIAEAILDAIGVGTQAEQVVALLAELATVAVTSYSKASGLPVNEDTIKGLYADPTPLPPPTQ